MTLTEKILAEHAGKDTVCPGELIVIEPDVIMANDITGPAAVNEFEKAGGTRVWNPDKIVLVPDHFAPCKDIASAALCTRLRNFAHAQGIKYYFEQGRGGIEHVLLPEKGLVYAGGLFIGADSHTCTYGALGCFSTGVGSTDFAAAMMSGKVWLKVPATIRVNLYGKPADNVSGKDIILDLIGRLGVDGASYKALEFGGSGLASLSMDDRFTMANMVIEAGAKNGVFEVDDIAKAYMMGHCRNAVKINVFEPDDDAEYSDIININLSKLEPVVAMPHLPSNVRRVSELEQIHVDQVVIGSCTNGRLSDMRVAAEVLNGKKVAENIRLIIIPGSAEVYSRCLKEGIIEKFIDAGAVVSTPTCGPCLGGYMGILDENEVCVSTTNRNFVGRMGHRDSKVYLASPYTAAVTAVNGYLGG